MSAMTLVRWSGLACIVAGLFWPLGQLIHPPHTPDGYQSSLWVPAHLLPYLAGLLALFGLVGLLARQLREAGRLGVIGFVLAFAGTALSLMGGREQVFIQPLLAARAPELLAPDALAGLAQLILTSLVKSVGYILLGVAIVRAGVVPWPVGILLAVGGPTLAFSPPIGSDVVFLVTGTIFGLGYAWLGYSLWTGTPGEQRVATATPVPRVALG